MMLPRDSLHGNPAPSSLRLVSIAKPAAFGWFASYINALADGHPRAAAAACQAPHGLGLVVLVRHDAEALH